MSNEPYKQYSATDLQRYLKGQMSAAEMHAIETAALDDPFLADAIEGFQTAMAEESEDSMNAALLKLNKQFADRIHPPARLVSMKSSKWWQISAAAMILLIAGVAIYNNRMEPERHSNSLAVTEKKQHDSNSRQRPEQERSSPPSNLSETKTNQDKKSTSPADPAKIVAPSPAIGIQKESDNQSLKVKKAVSPEKGNDKKDDLATQNEARSDKDEINEPAVPDQNVREQKKEVAASVSTETIARRNSQLYEQLNNFSGRVVDPDNKPLANASLQIMQNKTSLITDKSGNFNFSTSDSVVDVQVGLAGFGQRNFRLQNNIASGNLVLEPNKENLNEVVVTGYDKKRKKAFTKPTVKVQDAVPQIGWIEYEKYLEQNKKPPASNPSMKGEVVISFEVRRPAILSDFKTEKSLSKEYDDEAIRLIREGPSWKLLHGSKTRITVIVKF